MKLFKRNEETKRLEKLHLEAPWYSYCKKLQKLFETDCEIVVGDIYSDMSGEYDYGIDIEVRNHGKYLALSHLLPEVKTFGNVTVLITIFDEANGCGSINGLNLFETLFEGNSIVDSFKTIVDQAGVAHGYVCFSTRVIQFFDDNLMDYHGNWTGLAQDIAKDIFGDVAANEGVNFCTIDLSEYMTF